VRSPRTAVRCLVTGLIAIAVALAAGCGDDGGSETSPTVEWADGLCSAITTWRDSLTSTADSLRGGNLSEDSLRSAVDDFESATSDFVDDVRDLGIPETEAGEEAKASLDRLADDVEEGVSTMQSAVDDAEGAGGALEAISTVAGTLSTLGEQLASTFAGLEDLDAAGELEEAFREADACDELESASP
jgi:hypothetical protein